MMTFKLQRDNGEVVILSEKELDRVFLAARIVWMKDYVIDLLNWKEFDVESLTDEQIEEITGVFVERVTEGDALGELEAEVFDATMKIDFPEIKKIEEEK